MAYIPAGLVHALGRGVKVAEIQESSDITYRLYDYDRLGKDGKPRELHVKEALRAMNYQKHQTPFNKYEKKENGAANFVKDEHFTTNLLTFNQTIIRDYAPLDSFVVYICAEGEVLISANDTEVKIKADESVLIPASVEELRLQPATATAKVIETYIDYE